MHSYHRNPPFFATFSSTGFQEEVFCDHCHLNQIPLRYKNPILKPTESIVEQTLGSARWVSHCVAVKMPLCIAIVA